MSNTTPNTGPLDVGILFLDLVDSSVFASVLSLSEYAGFVRSFHEACVSQCEHFFSVFLRGKHERGTDYSIQIRGDELLVLTHTGKHPNDVYLLACLAASIKAAWLGSEFNLGRIKNRQPAVEIAAGIHHGPVWAEWNGSMFEYSGYAINLAKRAEAASREGNAYRIFLTDQAFKQVHFKQRNLLFDARRRAEMKGIIGQVGVYEVAHTFLNPEPRLHSSFVEPVSKVLLEAIQIASQEMWIHDLYQVWSEAKNAAVTDDALELCRQVLSHSPRDPVALYHLAQGLRERDEPSTAISVLQELIQAWPQFGDGHLELGKLLNAAGDRSAAMAAFRRAALLGVDEALALISGNIPTAPPP